MTRVLASFVLSTLLAAAVLGWPSDAIADVNVTSENIENGYPDTITFQLEASSGDEIVDVTLHYVMVGRNTSGFAKPDEFSAGSTIETDVVLRVNPAGSYIPVGTTFRYYWEITTADGEVTATPDGEFLYLPAGREWESVENDIMRVYYYGNRESMARSFLEAGEETYQQIAVDLLQAELPVTPVNVVVFPTSEEMAPARQGRGGSFDEVIRTCGVKLTVDVVFVVPQTCGTPDVTDTLRHEFGHIINQAAGEGAIGRLPSWIDEGTAVMAQTIPGDGFEGSFRAAVRADSLIPFNQMGTPSNDPRAVGLFYGQSWAMASYLVDEFGAAEYARFFATMKSGERFDRALEEVYGFTLREFEDEFRISYGLEPRGEPQTQPTEAPAQEPAPTTAPTRSPLQTTAPDSGSSGIDRTLILIIGIAVLFALTAIFFYLWGAMSSSPQTAARSAAGVPHAGDGDDWSIGPPPARSERESLLWDPVDDDEGDGEGGAPERSSDRRPDRE